MQKKEFGKSLAYRSQFYHDKREAVVWINLTNYVFPVADGDEQYSVGCNPTLTIIDFPSLKVTNNHPFIVAHLRRAMLFADERRVSPYAILSVIFDDKE